MDDECFDTPSFSEDRWCAERLCLDDIFIGENISIGMYSSVNVGCITLDDCTYIAKIINTDNGEYAEDFNDEVARSRAAGTLGIAPKVYKHRLCDVRKESEVVFNDVFGFIIMEKLDLSLAEFMKKKDLTEDNLEKLVFELKRLRDLCLENTITNNDLHDDNIMIKIKDNEVFRLYLIDFGRVGGFDFGKGVRIKVEWTEFFNDLNTTYQLNL